MKEQKQLLFYAAIFLVLLCGISGCGKSAGDSVTAEPEVNEGQKANEELEATVHTVTDLIGRTIGIPEQVNKVATLVGPSYDKVFMLGEKDKIAMLGFAQSAWAEHINPELAKIPTASNAQSPNIEELLKLNIDVVFTWDNPEPLEAMSNAGISALASLGSSAAPATAEMYIDAMKKEVNLYADVLGPQAQLRAQRYCDYLDDIVGRVTSVTSKLNENEKPNVYYIRGPEVFSTHGKYSNTRWYVEMAGGIMVSRDLEQLVPNVDIEQITSWDPDIIMMGRINTTDPIMNDPAWSAITAVKNGDVYVNPSGVFFWDYGAEGALFLLYLAKTFHPDHFVDIDMVTETKEFYANFYDYNLSDEEANKILLNMNP